MASIPFTMKVSDYSKLEGLLHLENRRLRFEFYHKETVLNWFGSSLIKTPVEIERISKIVHQQGWFSDRVVIQFNSMSDAESIPGAVQGIVRLKTKKRDRELVSSIVLDIELEKSHQTLEQLESRHPSIGVTD